MATYKTIKVIKNKGIRIYSYILLGTYTGMIVVSWALAGWKPVFKDTLLEFSPILTPFVGIMEGMIFAFIGYRKKLEAAKKLKEVSDEEIIEE